MKNFCKLIFILIFFSNLAKSQPITWQRFYSIPNINQSGIYIQQTLDEGYIACVLSNPRNILKINKFGIKEWQKSLLDSTDYFSPNAFIQINDSSLVFVGMISNSLAIYKTDKFGNTLWIRKFIIPGTSSEGFNIHVTQDGGFIIGGIIHFISTDSLISYVIKTNSEGYSMWQKQFGSDKICSGASIIQSQQELYYMTNSTAPNFQSLFKGFCYKLNSQGDIIWKKSIGYNKFVGPIYQTNYDTISLVGTYEPDSKHTFFYFEKLDTSGKSIRISEFPSTYSLRGICSDRIGNIIFSGSQLMNKKQFDFTATKFDKNGKFLINKILNTPSNSDDFNEGIEYTNDNGFVFIGGTNYNDSNSFNKNVLIAKTDSIFSAPNIVFIGNNEINFQVFELYQNFPNPFNNSTKILFELPTPTFIQLKIYDMMGKEKSTLIKGYKSSGLYEMIFDASFLSSGIYFYVLSSEKHIRIKKFVFLK